jgi:short-subunit dehydrogenase
VKIPLKNISEQVIVLTGATSGIGLATARMAARQGARLVISARNEDALKQVCEELNNNGAETIYVTTDVANENEVRNIAEAAIHRFGRIDTWMNLAGVTIFGKNDEVAISDMRRLFDVNFWGIVYGSLTALPYLKARGGALINMGSETSDRSVPLQGIYSASKHAVKGFTDSLRVELKEENVPVSVTLIKPASINTMLVKHAKNYMEVEPRLPPPIYAPEVVAEALLYAAAHPMRDMFVGGRAKFVSASGYYTPRMVDKTMTRLMYRYQRTKRAAHEKDDNNLYAPKADLLERGDVGGYTRKTSFYTNAVTHPAATKAAFIGAGLALAALWQVRRRQ